MGREIYEDQPNPIPNPNPNPEPLPPTPEPEQPEQPNPEQPNPEQPNEPADKVNPQIIDALTIDTVNTIATSPSFALASLYQHQVNHARRLDSMTEACLGKFLERMASDDPVETISIGKLLKAESDSSINSILAQLSAGQIGAKIAQSTSSDLSIEVAKLGGAIASVQGLIGGLVGLLQQMLMNTTPAEEVNNIVPMVQSKKKPDEIPVPPIHDLPMEQRKYPIVTIRY